MAYNYYPQYFQPNQNFQPNQAFQQQPQNYQQNQQVQNGGFVSVPSEEVARNYPVAIGNSVTFKNENAPYIYTKTMGFSQLDRPIFEKYKLIREEDTQNEQIQPQNGVKISGMENEVIDDLKGQIKALNEELEDVKKRLHELEDVGA